MCENDDDGVFYEAKQTRKRGIVSLTAIPIYLTNYNDDHQHHTLPPASIYQLSRYGNAVDFQLI